MSKAGKRLIKSMQEVTRIIRGEQKTLRVHGPAIWSYDYEAEAWYVRIEPRRKPPYIRQIHVEAIIDVADDGSLAGIEIIDDKCPPPFDAIVPCKP